MPRFCRSNKMSKQPFLYKFASKVNEAKEDTQIHFDESLGMNVFEDGTLAWSASSWYSNAYTAGHTVKAHRTPSNKWVPSKWVPSKTDRRKGK